MSKRNVANNSSSSGAVVANDRNVSVQSQPSRAIGAQSIIRALVAGFLLSVLSGCLSLGGDSSVVVYSPQVKIIAKPEWPSVNWPLVIDKPLASEMLTSPSIAVRPAPGTLQVYSGALWSDPAPDLLQTALVHGFEDSGKIASVGRQSTGLRSDFLLLLDLRQFESVYDNPAGPPSAVIEVQAKLLASPSNRVLAAKTFRVSVPARDKEIPQVVNAFETGLTDLTEQLVGWTLVTGQANVQRPAAAH